MTRILRAVAIAAAALFLMPIALAAIALIVVPLCLVEACRVETDLTWREKTLERKIQKDVGSDDRFVDIGVIIKVVVADDAGDELLPGLNLRVIREHAFGGILDTRANPPRLVARTREPVIWYCSEDQELALLHDDPDVPGQLIYGAEGSGKTRLLGMLHYLWWLENLGLRAEAGQTAPTKKRLRHVLEAMGELYPPQWYRYNKSEQVITFCDGHRIQFVSTKRQSEAQGSPVQGYNWGKGGAARDELQDQLDADFDVESRGRGAKIDRRNNRQVFRQAATCTAKHSSEFVSLVARKLGSGRWVKRLLLIADIAIANGKLVIKRQRSPFIHRSFLEEKMLVMTEREFRRRYGAEDLPPEDMVYFKWSRERNLKPLSWLLKRGAKKITSHVIRQKTGNPQHALLIGNDPGASKAGSIFLEAYEVPGEADPIWMVRGEHVTQNQTTEQHAIGLLKIVKQKFRANVRPGAELAHVRSHPYGQSESKPSLDVYRIFRRVGLHIRAAQYTKKGTGTGLIKKEDRIEMVNTLLQDAAGRTRLYVECDDKGQPVAPRLVESFESMERDDEGKAETEKKNAQDKSDPPAGLGYGLWPWEKEAARLARVRARRVS